jgi:hypothetical protein
MRSEDPHSAVGARLIRHIDQYEQAILPTMDRCEQTILSAMDAYFRRTMIWIGLLYLAMLGNIIKDFLR